MKKVAVIGGGASGMMAAITAAQNGADVILIEHKDRIGKKILSTGNGRCNFTNIIQEPIFYHSDNPEFPWKVIEHFDARSIISFFLQIGIYSKNRNGYIYPNSDQASAVLDALRMEIERCGVDVRTDTECIEIKKGKKQFTVVTDKGALQTGSVILCTGSRAAPVTGSDGSGYDLAKRFGHRIIPVLPALVQLKCQGKFFKQIAGVRVNGTVSVWSDNCLIAEDTGEIQITGYGLSGIPVFQISRYASVLLHEKKNVTAEIDFMPDFTREQFLRFLHHRAEQRPQKRADQFLIGLFHKKLSEMWIRQAQIPSEKKVLDFSGEDFQILTDLIKQFRVPVTGTNSFEQAQVCAGGVDTAQVDPDTMESLFVPGLYFAGELLDVDGMCGGYNLSFAWASGYTAGKSAAGSHEKK